MPIESQMPILNTFFKFASFGGENLSEEDLTATTQFMEDIATFFKDPRPEKMRSMTYTFSAIRHFMSGNRETFPPSSTDTRPYPFKAEKLDALQAAARQAVENFPKLQQHSDLRSQLPKDASFDDFMKLYVHIAERIQHTKVNELITATLSMQDRDNDPEANRQRAIHTLARMKVGDYDIIEGDIKHVHDYLNQLKEGLDTLSGNLVEDTPRLFELAEFAAAMNGLGLKERQPTERSPIAQLTKVAPIIEQIKEIYGKWTESNFPPEYKNSRPEFYLSHHLQGLSSIRDKYQVATLLEVSTGNMSRPLSEQERAILTLAKVASGDYSIEPSEIAGATAWFSLENQQSEGRRDAQLATQLFNRMKQLSLVDESPLPPPPEIHRFMATVKPFITTLGAHGIGREFDKRLNPPPSRGLPQPARQDGYGSPIRGQGGRER